MILNKLRNALSNKKIGEIKENGNKFHEPLVEGSIITIEFLENRRFEIAKIIQGGMGVVYQLIPIAKSASIRAAKLFKGPDQAIFKKEAEVWFNLGSHPNIAQPLWYGIWREQNCIIMDWYEESLATINPFKCDYTKIVTSIVTGLDYATQKSRLIHQDIKPANILIDSNENPRIADFGIAIAYIHSPRDRTVPIKITDNSTISFGDVAGTPIYMAPEILNKTAKPSISTDIYSLGVTLFEWFTKQHPYLGPDTDYCFRPKLRVQVLNRIEEDLDKSGKLIAEIITKCLEIDPSNRPKSYKEILKALPTMNSISTKVDGRNPQDLAIKIKLYLIHDEHEKAERILFDFLKEKPNDPLMLNLLGRHSLAQGRTEAAVKLFYKAFRSLDGENGFYNGKPYLDPAMNYAKALIVSSDYEIASEILLRCLSWYDERNINYCYQFEEFGWLFLYMGKAREAFEFLYNLSKSKKFRYHEMQWLTLSAYYANILHDCAKELSLLWTDTEESLDIGNSVAMSLCAMFAPISLKKSLIELVKNKFGGLNYLSSIGNDKNLKKDWYMTKLDSNIRILVEKLDKLTTGGSNSDRPTET